MRGKMNFGVSILCICVVLVGSCLGQMAEEQEDLPDVVSERPGADAGKCLSFIDSNFPPLHCRPY